MTVLPIGVANFDPADGAALPADLAVSLISLLETAKQHLDRDRETAKASIARASSLLQFEVDRKKTAGETPAPPLGALAAWQANRVRAHIDAHLDTPIQIRDLAAIARRSPAYFCRAFKRTFSETPHAFIIGRRLRRAAELMLTSDSSLAQVALACGFADQAHLCKMFRLRHGVSPAVWRRERRDVRARDAASTGGADRELMLSDAAA